MLLSSSKLIFWYHYLRILSQMCLLDSQSTVIQSNQVASSDREGCQSKNKVTKAKWETAAKKKYYLNFFFNHRFRILPHILCELSELRSICLSISLFFLIWCTPFLAKIASDDYSTKTDFHHYVISTVFRALIPLKNNVFLEEKNN